MQKRLVSLVLALALMLTAFAGCGSDTGSSSSAASGSSAAGSSESSTSSAAESSSTSTDGEQTLVRMNIGSEPDSLDPWQSAASDTEAIMHNVFEGLCLYDENGEIIPGLAERWDISEDGLTYTFHLRQGVTFHDGEPFNAEAAIANIESWHSNPSMGSLPGVVNYTNIEAVDDYTVRLTYDNPYFAYINDFCWPDVCTMISPKLITQGDFQTVNGYAGTGPYIYDEYVAGQYTTFVRNENYKHIRLGKMMRFSSPTAFMAQRKSTVDDAYPGDIVGLPDTGNFKIGDTLTAGEELHYKGLPSFSPEMFKYIENTDPMKTKQLNKGLDQLMGEGVAQMFVNQFNGRKIIGTVGQLQFEVIQYRLLHEYGAQCRWEPISLYKACWIESDDAEALENFKKRKYQFMAKDRDDRDVFLADSGYVLQMAQSDFPKIRFHFTSEF